MTRVPGFLGFPRRRRRRRRWRRIRDRPSTCVCHCGDAQVVDSGSILNQ